MLLEGSFEDLLGAPRGPFHCCMAEALWQGGITLSCIISAWEWGASVHLRLKGADRVELVDEHGSEICEGFML